MVQIQEPLLALEGGLLEPLIQLVDQAEHLLVVGLVLERLCVHLGFERFCMMAEIVRHNGKRGNQIRAVKVLNRMMDGDEQDANKAKKKKHQSDAECFDECPKVTK